MKIKRENGISLILITISLEFLTIVTIRDISVLSTTLDPTILSPLRLRLRLRSSPSGYVNQSERKR